jgi:hypothetical protein
MCKVDLTDKPDWFKRSIVEAEWICENCDLDSADMLAIHRHNLSEVGQRIMEQLDSIENMDALRRNVNFIKIVNAFRARMGRGRRP